MIIGFTGHRPRKLPGSYENSFIYVKPPLQLSIEKIKDEYSLKKAYCGMALGFDQYAARVCMDMEIPVVAAVPCKNYECRWPEDSQKVYRDMLQEIEEKGGEVVILAENYTHSCLYVRNRYIVDHSHILIACWNGSSGGTDDCIYYAKRRGNEIINIWKDVQREENKWKNSRK
jgi:uncharacterized phage-like protein YoqJ